MKHLFHGVTTLERNNKKGFFRKVPGKNFCLPQCPVSVTVKHAGIKLF